MNKDNSNYAILDLIEKYEKELRDLIQKKKDHKDLFSISFKLPRSTVRKFKGLIITKGFSPVDFFNKIILDHVRMYEESEGTTYDAPETTNLKKNRKDLMYKSASLARHAKQLKHEIEVLRRILDREI